VGVGKRFREKEGENMLIGSGMENASADLTTVEVGVEIELTKIEDVEMPNRVGEKMFADVVGDSVGVGMLPREMDGIAIMIGVGE
jgi:hypothetical protein